MIFWGFEISVLGQSQGKCWASHTHTQRVGSLWSKLIVQITQKWKLGSIFFNYIRGLFAGAHHDRID